MTPRDYILTLIRTVTDDAKIAELCRQKFGNPDMSFEEVSDRFASEKVFDMPPAGRLGMPEELALVACMLASPRSGFITGANYRVDGGQVRGLN